MIARPGRQRCRKLETVEYAAQVVFLARRLGTLRTLTPDQTAKPEDVAIKLGSPRHAG